MRGADAGETWKWMKYYYQKRRIRVKTVIQYAMTPNALGGFGLSKFSKMYPFIQKEWDCKWVEITREFEFIEIGADLGAWREMAANLGFDVKEQEQSILTQLLPTWGIS